MSLERISSEFTFKEAFRKESAWNIFSDYSRFPSYSKNIDKILVTGKNSTESVSEWDVTFDGAPLSWIQKDVFDKPCFAVTFKALSGDFDQFGGTFQIQDSEGSIGLAYALNYKVGIPIIEDLFGPVFKEKMQINFDALVHGIATEIGKQKFAPDERLERRYKIGVQEVMTFDGKSIEAKIENISSSGIMFTSETDLEKPVSVHACGLDLMPRELHYEVFDKKYRLILEKPIDNDRLLRVVKMLQSRHVTTLGRFLVLEPKSSVYS